jgi:demethoxyubiquinone hydroxylase (CLK1/Coq7/Cat5 family)
MRSAGLFASLCAVALFTSAVRAQTPSFVNDVESVLTRLGCNQGSCHGKGSGQNGFRLSLRAYAPEWDHAWITREFATRRINPTNPEASLLLLKPTGQAAHEGGVLISVGSREYNVLLDWIRGGAPGIGKDDPVLRRLEVKPAAQSLKPGATQQLSVTAEYSDGKVKDVTWLAKFDSNDAGVASVSPTGLIKVERSGETAIRAMFQGQVAVAVVTAPLEQAVKAEWYQGRNNLIDEHVFRKLQELRIEPSSACDDATFIRRVYLDAMGILPTPAEMRDFVNDTAKDKRAKLIDAVLERPEFVDFWTMQLNDLLMNRKEGDHDVRGTKGVRNFHDWIRKQVAGNRPWDEMTRDLLTVSGSTHEQPAVGYFIVNVGEHRESHKSTVVASAAQTFLGVRIGCAQCHNHPLEKYTQDDYYHFAGYFSRIRLDRKDPKSAPTVLSASMPDAKQNKNPVGVTQPRTGKFMVPQTLDRTPIKVEPEQDPRLALAAWMTDPKNEYFAGAMVNRIWAHYFNVGLVEPVDDLRESNPPSSPALWKALVQEFVAKKYDRKHMMRLILNSRAYQLGAATKPTNEKDLRFYSHYYARRLPSEVLHDAIYTVTGVADAFDGYPAGLRAVQIPDPGVKSKFLSIFPRSERITACACERSPDVTLVHTLHLISDNTWQKVRAADGRLAGLLKTRMADADLLDELFLAALSRLPKDQDRQVFAKHLAQRRAEVGDRGRSDAFEDIMWALLNTKEFLFNH